MSGLRTLRIPRSSAFLAVLIAVPLILLLASACGGDDAPNTNDDKIQVVTTLPLFADFVRNVGGDRVDVTSLLPLGADPHTFEPSPRDVEPITKADIAFANGLDLEPGLIKVLEANLPDDAELVKLGEKTAEFWKTDDPSFPDDPHLWLNPALAENYLTIIMGDLAALDPQAGPGSAEYFVDRKGEFNNRVGREVSVYLLEKTAEIPRGNRKLVTTHEAFHHFADVIGFEAVAAVAESPGQEPSPNEIADLTAAIKDQNIPAVFSEPQISEESHILEQAAADAGVQVCTLYSDSLDDEVSTYIEMMRFNADELARCLGGD